MGAAAQVQRRTPRPWANVLALRRSADLSPRLFPLVEAVQLGLTQGHWAMGAAVAVHTGDYGHTDDGHDELDQ